MPAQRVFPELLPLARLLPVPSDSGDNLFIWHPRQGTVLVTPKNCDHVHFICQECFVRWMIKYMGWPRFQIGVVAVVSIASCQGSVFPEDVAVRTSAVFTAWIIPLIDSWLHPFC